LTLNISETVRDTHVVTMKYQQLSLIKCVISNDIK